MYQIHSIPPGQSNSYDPAFDPYPFYMAQRLEEKSNGIRDWVGCPLPPFIKYMTISEIEKALDEQVEPQYRHLYRIVYFGPAIPPKEPKMDELVYFAASFHCIPLSKADEIRAMLMEIMPDTQFNFDYSKPIIQEED